MRQAAPIPQFHLYGETTDDQVFDFVHVETIASRSSRHGWRIAPHSHRHLAQVLFISGGGGVMDLETSRHDFSAPALIFVQPLLVHGFRFAEGTEGFVLSWSLDVMRGAAAPGDRIDDLLAEAQRRTILRLGEGDDLSRLADLFARLAEEHELGRDGHRLAMRACLVLLAVEAARLASGRMPRPGLPARRFDATMEALRDRIERDFRRTRRLADYAGALGMTPDRLNEHCKRTAGVTAGHLIRQRVVTEAKRQLMLTGLTVAEIAYDLGFSDPTHFTRFFRRYTGVAPQAFREGRGQD